MRAYEEGGEAALAAKRRGRKPGSVARLLPSQAKQIREALIDHRPEQLKLPFFLWTRGVAGRSFSPKGQTPVIAGTGQRFGCNMIRAITNQGALSFILFEETFTVSVFLRFLRRLIRQSEKKIYLIVDAHPVHRAKLVSAWLQKHAGKIRMIRLPSYSPELNQDVKSNAPGRKRPATRAELMQRVRSYLHRRQRTPHLVRRCFLEHHVRYAAA